MDIPQKNKILRQKRSGQRRQHPLDLIKGFWRDRVRRYEKKKRKRKKTAYLRKKRRAERIAEWRRAIQKIIRNPLFRKRLSRRDKLLRKTIKQEIRQQRKQQYLNFPSHVAGAIRKKSKERRRRWKYAIKTFREMYFSESRMLALNEVKRDFSVLALNSTAMYIIAFWVMYFTGQLVSIGVAGHFSIPAKLFSYQTAWPLYKYSEVYTRENIILIFGLGPLVCLLIALALAAAFRLLVRIGISLKVLWLWMAFHGFNLFFGGYVSGIASNTGMKFFSAWLLNSQGTNFKEIIIAGLAIVVMIAAGSIATRYFLQASPSQEFIRSRLRFFYLVAQAFIPWLAGTLVISLTNLPTFVLSFMLLLGTSALLILPVLANHNAPASKRIRISKAGDHITIGWLYIFIFAVLTIFIRFYVYAGIQFGESL